MNLENKKQLVTLILAIGLGLLAAYLASQYVENNIKKQTTMLAREYQKQNAAFMSDMDQVKKEMSRLAQKQAQLDKEQKELQDQKVDIKALAARLKEEQIQAQGERAPIFSIKTPEGKRAVTILIDSLSAVGGLVNAGDFVDIIAQLEVPKALNPRADSDKVTTVLFQNLQVLAVGTNFDPGLTKEYYETQQKARALNLTLAVDPDEAALLTFAQTNGKMQLSLRGPEDREKKELDIASWDTLSDYVLEQQGTELQVPPKNPRIEVTTNESTKEAEPFIQIFRGGREL